LRVETFYLVERYGGSFGKFCRTLVQRDENLCLNFENNENNVSPFRRNDFTNHELEISLNILKKILLEMERDRERQREKEFPGEITEVLSVAVTRLGFV